MKKLLARYVVMSLIPEKYEYDEKRNHVKTITMTYDPDGSMTGYTEYVYDEDGTTISVTEFDKDGNRIIHDDY